MNYNKDNGLLNMIRRTDPMIKATPQLKELYRYLEINKIDNYSRPR